MRQLFYFFLVVLALPAAAQPCETFPDEEAVAYWSEAHEAGKHARERNKLREAREQFAEARERAAALGLSGDAYRDSTRELAAVLSRMKRLGQARAILDASLEELEQACGDDHPAIVRMLQLRLAYTHDPRIEPATLIPDYERMVAIAERHWADDPRAIGPLLQSLATAHYRAGDLEQAIAIGERLHDLYVQSEFAAGLDREELGNWYFEAGRYEAALPILRRNLEACSERPCFERARNRYAAALTAQGQDEFAREVRSMAPPWEDELEALETPPARQSTPLIAGMNGVTHPRKLSGEGPVFPEEAREKRFEGSVILQATIGVDGRVGETEVVRCSNPGVGFEEAAQRAVEQWRYAPATKDGEPVEVYFTVFVEFKLH